MIPKHTPVRLPFAGGRAGVWRLDGPSENGSPHETSSLSYTQTSSTKEPSNMHGLSLIHRVSDTPKGSVKLR